MGFLSENLTKLCFFISSVKLGNHHIFIGNQLFCLSSEQRVLPRQSCCSILPKGTKIPTQTFQKISPKNGLFWPDCSRELAPSWQGRSCWSRVDVGERWSKEKPWKVWVDLEEKQLFGVVCGGKSDFSVDPAGLEGSQSQQAKMPLKESSNSSCFSRR